MAWLTLWGEVLARAKRSNDMKVLQPCCMAEGSAHVRYDSTSTSEFYNGRVSNLSRAVVTLPSSAWREVGAHDQSLHTTFIQRLHCVLNAADSRLL